jgi:sugar/nucleoside kinase (ribokinase family)
MAIPEKWDVLALGNTAVDDLLFVESFPNSDTKTPILHSQRQCGGLAATAIVAASRLGARCAYAGALGEDELSQFVEQTLAREGVDVAHVVRRADAAPVHSRIVVGAGGTRNIFYEMKGFSGADENAPGDETIGAARVLLVDRWGVAGTLRAMKIARENQIPTVGDIERSGFDGFDEWMQAVNHLIVPQEFALAISHQSTPGAAARKLWSAAREVVVVTCGENGCWALESESAEPQFFPAFKVDAVDTTGCGDVFHGAYAAALARNENLEMRLRFASAAAAMKATQPGGQSGIPTHAAVKEFLKCDSELSH